MPVQLQIFTLIHVFVSLLGIIAGLVVAGGLVANARLDDWTATFLATTIFTNVSGFAFPFMAVTPAHVVGTISLLVLAVCLAARYWKQLEGRWRATYVVTTISALYLNVFVLVVQLFVKTPALAELAPTQQEAPFVLTQLLVLLLFLWLGEAALRGFRMAGPGAASEGARDVLRT